MRKRKRGEGKETWRRKKGCEVFDGTGSEKEKKEGKEKKEKKEKKEEKEKKEKKDNKEKKRNEKINTSG